MITVPIDLINRGVICHRVFGDRIVDLLTVCKSVKIIEGPFPSVVFRDYHEFTGVNAVCVQADGDAFRTVSILIIVVDPGLAAGNADRFIIQLIGEYDSGIFIYPNITGVRTGFGSPFVKLPGHGVVSRFFAHSDNGVFRQVCDLDLLSVFEPQVNASGSFCHGNG